MGSAVAFVYAVPRTELLRVPGSRQKRIIKMIAKDYWRLEAVAESFEDDDLPIDLVGAVTQIVNGEPLQADLGSLYLCAVEAICWYLGSTLVLPIDFPEHEVIDRQLAAHGCPLRVADLVFCGSPLAIPAPDCPPSMGWWSPEAIMSGASLIERIPLKGVGRGAARGLAEVRRWLAETRKVPDGCLVGTYY
jgi:hypothetical protein